MQTEIDSLVHSMPVSILGVNAVGAESGNALMCQNRQLPWLQDTPETNAWGLWDVTYRDVVVLDGNNRYVKVYNLTIHDLANPTYYAELKEILLKAAR